MPPNTNATQKARNEKAMQRAMQHLMGQSNYHDQKQFSNKAHREAREAYLREQALGKRAGKSKRRKTKRRKTRNKN